MERYLSLGLESSAHFRPLLASEPNSVRAYEAFNAWLGRAVFHFKCAADSSRRQLSTLFRGYTSAENATCSLVLEGLDHIDPLRFEFIAQWITAIGKRQTKAATQAPPKPAAAEAEATAPAEKPEGTQEPAGISHAFTAAAFKL